jgi:hypothetical protein
MVGAYRCFRASDYQYVTGQLEYVSLKLKLIYRRAMRTRVSADAGCSGRLVWYVFEW